MPDQKLTQLPVLAALSADDIFYVVDDPAGAASSRQVAASVFDARYLQAANNLSDLTNAVVARASLGLGTLAVINSPLPIINGGSGQATQQTAIDALTNVAAATNEHVLTKDTATGNAIFKASAGGTTLPVADTQTIVKGSADATKLLRFEVDGFTAGATRVLTPPNADATIAGLEVANVFTLLNSFSTGITIGSNPASGGAIRLQNNVNINWRNAIDTADVTGFRVDNTNSFTMAGSAIYAWGGGGTTTLFVANNDGNVAIGNAQTNPSTKLFVKKSDAVTAAITDVVAISHVSSGTPAAGFGPGLIMQGESSTTENQSMGRLTYEWATATHASRKALGKLTVYDTAEREAIRIEASGTAAMVGFLGAAAIIRQAHIVDPAGGGTVDAEARTAINAILVVLENFGFTATS